MTNKIRSVHKVDATDRNCILLLIHYEGLCADKPNIVESDFKLFLLHIIKISCKYVYK